MENSITVYLIVDNPILKIGFEGLIISAFQNSSVHCISSPKELFEIDFNKNPKEIKILIYDSSIEFDQSNLFLHNLLQNNTQLRTLVLAHEFNHNRFKFLFNAGIYGVFSPEITSENFICIVNDVIQNRISLDPKFQNLLVQKFCSRESSAVQVSNNDLEIEENYYDNNYVQELYGLTKREKEILCLICNGQNTKEISDTLFISLHTAETHRRNLLYKLDVKNTAEMVKVAVLSKLIAI